MGAGDDAGVANLSAALGVETGFGEDDFHLLPGSSVSHGLAIAQNAHDVGLNGSPVVAVERSMAGAEVFVGGDDFHAAGNLMAGAGHARAWPPSRR